MLFLTGRLARRADGAFHERYAGASQRMVEFSQAQSVLRAFNGEGGGMRFLEQAVDRQRQSATRLIFLSSLAAVLNVWAIQAVFAALLVAAAVWLNGSLGGALATPDVIGAIVALLLVGRYIDPLLEVAGYGDALRGARGQLDAIRELFAVQPLPETDTPQAPGDAAIELRGLHFRYAPDAAEVLRGIDLRIAPGSMTALIGPSGSGRRPLARLIARFFDASQGSVLIGGVDVRRMSGAQLAGQLGQIFQDSYLFTGSIADNIRVGKPDATEAELMQAARQAGVTEIVARLPQGMDTPVGEGGARLSGGERQRIAIARALLKNAPILLVDEATAALDAENQHVIAETLARLRGRCTLVVIAHQLSTVAMADQIVVLEDGRVVEQGAPADLRERRGRYAEFLAQRQAAKGWRITAADGRGPDASAPVPAAARIELRVGADRRAANGMAAAFLDVGRRLADADGQPAAAPLAALVLTGVGLSVCGVILQHIVRNRFVEPGTSGGLDAAKLGILVSLTLAPAAGVASRMLFALAFCFAASMLYVAIIRRIKFRNTVLVPVVGLMYGSVLSAVAEFYAYRHNILQSMQGWLLGDFSRVVQGRYEILYLVLPVVALAYLYAHRFTVLGMGEEMAASLGLGYAATAALGLVLVAVTVSASVIVVGAIPFIGLVVPNLVALRHGENLGRTLPIVALGGASLLLACDIVGRLLMHPFEVPIGLTAGGVGGALFLILILRGCDDARLPSVADSGGGGRAGGGVRARGFGPGFRLRDPEAAGPAGRHRRRRRLRGPVGHRVPDAGEQPHPDARHHGLQAVYLLWQSLLLLLAGAQAQAALGAGGGFIVSLLLMLAYSWGIHRWLLRGGATTCTCCCWSGWC